MIHRNTAVRHGHRHLAVVIVNDTTWSTIVGTWRPGPIELPVDAWSRPRVPRRRPTPAPAAGLGSSTSQECKTGVVFMAYLNGQQDHFVMVGRQESARSLLQVAELFRLADAAGLLRNPDLRMRKVMAVQGVEG